MSSGQGLLRREVVEVCVVRKDLGLVRITLQVMAEVLEGTDDSEEFFVMDFVVAFSRLEGLGVVCHWVGASQCIVLF